MELYAKLPPMFEVVRYKTSNGSDDAELYDFLNEMVNFESMVWFNYATRAWEPFSVGDAFMRPRGSLHVETKKLTSEELLQGWEYYSSIANDPKVTDE